MHPSRLPAMPAQDLTLTTDSRDAGAVIHVIGELDLSTVAAFDAELLASLTEKPGRRRSLRLHVHRLVRAAVARPARNESSARAAASSRVVAPSPTGAKGARGRGARSSHSGVRNGRRSPHVNRLKGQRRERARARGRDTARARGRAASARRCGADADRRRRCAARFPEDGIRRVVARSTPSIIESTKVTPVRSTTSVPAPVRSPRREHPAGSVRCADRPRRAALRRRRRWSPAATRPGDVVSRLRLEERRILASVPLPDRP